MRLLLVRSAEREAQAAPLVEAVADVTSVLEARHVIDDRELAELPGLVVVPLETLDHERSLPAPVPPVGVQPVAGADADEAMDERRHPDLEAAPRSAREAQRRALDQPRSPGEPVLVLGATEVIGRARGVRPDADRLLQLALPRVRLLEDVEDRVVGELHRRVVPHAGERQLALTDPRVLGLPHRAHAPRAVARPPPAVGRDGEGLAPDAKAPRPAAGLREARGVEERATVAADEVARLPPGGDRALPDEVEGDPVLGLVEGEAQPAQRLQHLDLERSHARVAPVAEGARGAHHEVPRAAARDGEGVLHAEVRVLAHAHHDEELVARGVEVEVVAVVEVAIAGADVAHHVGGLVDGVVVPGGEHRGASLRRRCA